MKTAQNPLLGSGALRKAALTSSISLLVMFVAAMVAEFAFHQGLIVQGNASLTATKIGEAAGLARIGLGCFVLVLLCDLLVTWGLYVFFKPVHPRASLVSAALRLVYSLLFGAAIFRLFLGFSLVQNGGSEAANMEAMQQFQAFDGQWAFAMIIFGIHVLVLGFLVMRSGFMPKLLSVLLFIAGCAYCADNAAKLWMPDYAQIKDGMTVVVALSGILSEVGLAVWLLLRGGKTKIATAK